MPADKVQFSIVSAVYNVSGYLDEYIASIEAQDHGLGDVEVIMVDDGSTDDSLARLEAWQRRRPELVTVLTKPNGGQASARNLGLEHARGEWVTFPDPDDMLAANYLTDVAQFLDRHPETVLVATNRLMLQEATGEITLHPLHRHFLHRNRLRNLNEHPTFFHGSAPSSFFRREVLERENLRFSELIRPNFEDGHFCSVYLLRAPTPFVGFVRSAEYTYRKRSDQSSTLNTSLANAGRFTAVLEHGYLDVLRQAQDGLGYVPEWLQNFILYELSWYFRDEEAAGEGQTAAIGEVADQLHQLLPKIAELLTPSVVLSFSVRHFKLVWREFLLHAYRPEPWHTSFATVTKLDMRQRLVRVVYRYTKDAPDEQFFSDGVPVKPAYGKVRGIPYFERTLLFERIAWLPFGNIRVTLDGEDLDVRVEDPERPVHSLNGWTIRQTYDPQIVAEETDRERVRLKRRVRDRAVVWLARTPVVRRFFARAWVLMDRIHNADDSAEILFRYLRAHRRRTNAWFVIQSGTADYKRLRKDGYKRIIPYGSFRWKLLMLNCEHLISSHADLPIISPKALRRLTTPTWRLVFLQHGVIKDDLSRWLNRKDLDLFITSTPGEHRSVVADGTNYRYTERETKLTGLPRFDKILEMGKKYGPDQRDLILIAPTWRHWLMEATRPNTQRWAIELGRFSNSDFAQNWMAVLRSPELAELAERTGTRVAVLMHPNLQAVVPMMEVPPHVEKLSFEGQDVRKLFARARVLVTDYSSMAFNAAYIERPVVYFQFDRERVLNGGHLGHRGYFEYERDGFGPVAFTPEEAVREILTTVEYGPAPQPEYRQRIEATFPMRDGRCSERVADAIRESVRRVQLPTETDEVNAGRDAGLVGDDEAEMTAETVAVDEAIAADDDAGPLEEPDPADTGQQSQPPVASDAS